PTTPTAIIRPTRAFRLVTSIMTARSGFPNRSRARPAAPTSTAMPSMIQPMRRRRVVTRPDPGRKEVRTVHRATFGREPDSSGSGRRRSGRLACAGRDSSGPGAGSVTDAATAGSSGADGEDGSAGAETGRCRPGPPVGSPREPGGGSGDGRSPARLCGGGRGGRPRGSRARSLPAGHPGRLFGRARCIGPARLVIVGGLAASRRSVALIAPGRRCGSGGSGGLGAPGRLHGSRMRRVLVGERPQVRLGGVGGAGRAGRGGG